MKYDQSVLLRSVAKSCVCAQVVRSPQCRKDIDLLEQAQRRATKVVRAGTPLLLKAGRAGVVQLQEHL